METGRSVSAVGTMSGHGGCSALWDLRGQKEVAGDSWLQVA